MGQAKASRLRPAAAPAPAAPPTEPGPPGVRAGLTGSPALEPAFSYGQGNGVDRSVMMQASPTTKQRYGRKNSRVQSVLPGRAEDRAKTLSQGQALPGSGSTPAAARSEGAGPAPCAC